MNASTHDIIQTVVEKVREESQDGTVYHIRVLTETGQFSSLICVNSASPSLFPFSPFPVYFL